jgi:hypothetical protein
LIQVFVKYNYQRESRFVFLVRPLTIQWSLCYNFIDVYFIKFSNEKVGLKTRLTNEFQTYLFPTFIIRKFLKFYSWFTINPIEGSIVSRWNLIKFRNYFLVFSWKATSFLIWYFLTTFSVYFTMLSFRSQIIWLVGLFLCKEDQAVWLFDLFICKELSSLTIWFCVCKESSSLITWILFPQHYEKLCLQQLDYLTTKVPKY